MSNGQIALEGHWSLVEENVRGWGTKISKLDAKIRLVKYRYHRGLLLLCSSARAMQYSKVAFNIEVATCRL